MLMLTCSVYASLGENPNLCLSVSCKGKQNKNFIVPVLASIISVLVLFLLIAVGIIWNFKRKEDTGIFFLSFPKTLYDSAFHCRDVTTTGLVIEPV